MGYTTKGNVFDKECWICWPAGESIVQWGTHLSCNLWPDRISDCRINGQLVTPLRYRMAKRGSKVRRPMTPHDLRFRLRCYVHPVVRS